MRVSWHSSEIGIPWPRVKTCTPVRGLLDEFFTYLALVETGEDLHGTTDGVLVVVLVGAVVVKLDGVIVAVGVMKLPGEGFEWPWELLYTNPLSLLFLPAAVL